MFVNSVAPSLYGFTCAWSIKEQRTGKVQSAKAKLLTEPTVRKTTQIAVIAIRMHFPLHTHTTMFPEKNVFSRVKNLL